MKFTGAILRIQAVNSQEYVSLVDAKTMLKSGEELEKRVEELEAELGSVLEEKVQLQEEYDELKERLENGLSERATIQGQELFVLKLRLEWTEKLVEKLLQRRD